MNTAAHVENTVLIIVTGFLAWQVSPWCFFLLLLINFPRK